MLGNRPEQHNSIFLLARWTFLVAFAATLCPAATALRSPHFTIYSSSLTAKQAEATLARLEFLRTALTELHGPSWVPAAPLTVFVPASEKQWHRLAGNPAEQGYFLSGSRRHWIVVNPVAPFFVDVLSHEYLHAVIHHALPNIPTWFEEGICEYYSTLELEYKSGSSQILLGRPPARRLRQLQGVSQIDLASLSKARLDVDSYALAWAAAYVLWPAWQPGQDFPAKIPVGPFPLRRRPSRASFPNTEFLTLSPAATGEIEAALAQSFPKLALATPDNAEQEFLSGSRLLDAGQAAAALPILESACRQRPSQSTWWLTLALAYRETGRLSAARQTLDHALNSALNQTERDAAQALLKTLGSP